MSRKSNWPDFPRFMIGDPPRVSTIKSPVDGPPARQHLRGCCGASGEAGWKMFATGFHLEPLPNSHVLIRFQGDDGTTVNTQVVTREVLCRLSVVVHAFFVAVNEGEDAARDF